MKNSIIGLAMLAVFAATPTRANPLEDRVAVLSTQVVTLQRELAVLKSMLARDATGNLAFTVTGGRTDRVGLDASATVGANSSSSVGGDMTATIGRSSTTRIGGTATQTVGGNALSSVNGSSTSTVAVNSAVNVGGSATRQVGGSSTDTVSGNASQQVGGSMGVAVARNLTLEAADQIMLKSGSASIILKKNGEILITGATVNIRASADVVLKGTRVLTN